MAKYEITIEEELNLELVEIANSTSRSVEDILHDIIIHNLKTEKVNLVIQQYKDGYIKAREAWKLTGLSYQEFQDLVNSS